MKTKIVYILVLLAICNSCNQITEKRNSTNQPYDILKNQSSYLNYMNLIKLSKDFIPLDTSSETINKSDFFEKLSSGLYLPLEEILNDSLYYKLYKINIPVDDYIRLSLKNRARVEIIHYKMEGKLFPKFNLVDLNGNVYNESTTKGKILVLKCWFIRCHKCLEEMPSLNTLVEKYKSNKNILFLSLALDDEKDLINFLKTKSFNYAVIANQADFMTNTLKIDMYPTHIIIDANGLVVKVVNDKEEMEPFLEKEALK